MAEIITIGTALVINGRAVTASTNTYPTVEAAIQDIERQKKDGGRMHYWVEGIDLDDLGKHPHIPNFSKIR